MQYSQDALDFVEKLIEKAKDPDKISAYIPTIEDLKTICFLASAASP